ncbi:hypothetical protein ZHAS_00016180 [Anopheles sinensis]|uniref:Uncharacterized protein n=1 Tax=Anopheles sinensis TaxID=74873 RepID=A0A084WCW3_ANOSI|nr:hypothetical protein ZHAS_00016180 [Anopheles sinensis]
MTKGCCKTSPKEYFVFGMIGTRFVYRTNRFIGGSACLASCAADLGPGLIGNFLSLEDNHDG